MIFWSVQIQESLERAFLNKNERKKKIIALKISTFSSLVKIWIFEVNFEFELTTLFRKIKRCMMNCHTLRMCILRRFWWIKSVAIRHAALYFTEESRKFIQTRTNMEKTESNSAFYFSPQSRAHRLVFQY